MNRSNRIRGLDETTSHSTIDTSIIHDTLAVIANEVKQSSKTKMHFFKPSGLPRRLCLLMELLVEPSHPTIDLYIIHDRCHTATVIPAKAGIQTINEAPTKWDNTSN
ncbi:MAG: hypothetical protein ACYCY7_06755, partial [Gallionella sp.]